MRPGLIARAEEPQGVEDDVIVVLPAAEVDVGKLGCFLISLHERVPLGGYSESDSSRTFFSKMGIEVSER